MKQQRSRIALLLAAGVLLVNVWRTPADPPALLPADRQSPEALRQRYGPPSRVARQIVYGRYREQWEYDGPPERLQLDGGRGRDPRLLP